MALSRMTLFLAALLAASLTLVACSDDSDDGDASGDMSMTGGSGGDGGGSTVDDALALTGDATSGETLYSSSCGLAACHGSDGMSGPAPSIAGTSLDDRTVADIIVNGQGNMPAQNLDAQGVADVLVYLDTL